MNPDHDKSMDPSNDMKSHDCDILIVDDEIPNLQLLTQLLSAEGYQVRPAERPQLAIESALAKPPSLILLDVRMPEMDGFEVCERLKQDERTHDIPIIFVSALQNVQDRIQGFEAGGVDFISKPFQEAEVLARVRTHMDLRNMQLGLEALVAERTTDLEAEIIERKQAGKALSESVKPFQATSQLKCMLMNSLSNFFVICLILPPTSRSSANQSVRSKFFWRSNFAESCLFSLYLVVLSRSRTTAPLILNSLVALSINSLGGKSHIAKSGIKLRSWKGRVTPSGKLFLEYE